MSSESSPPEDSREERLDALIAEYLTAAQEGNPPDRQELLRRHPDLAEPLREFFADEDNFRSLTAPLAPRPAPPPIHDFGDYRIHGEMARGGMGVVYRATQISLNRPVALKMILAGPWAAPDQIQRFRSEAEAVAALDHPQIVPIYEVGQHNGQPYFSMKLLEGGDLTRHLDRYRKDPRAAAALVASLAHAIHHAHQRGILHRDLKPRNILLDGQGQPQITDFGLAKRTDDRGQETNSGAIVGTASYMAPEQARGQRPLSVAVDIFSLGAILYELLTGRPPFRSTTPAESLLQLLESDPKPPRALNPRLDRDLETICLKCLQKVPGQRYGSAEALAEDLERWLRGQPITARAVGDLERLWRWCRRNPALTSVLAGATGVILLISVLFSWSLIRENARTRAALEAASEARDRAQDRLARSRYEQARALLASARPGRRWEVLSLVKEAESLRKRARETSGSPGADSDLPARWQLRSEALSAMLQSDARTVWSTSTGVTQPGLTADTGLAVMLQKASPDSQPELVLLNLRSHEVLHRLNRPEVSGSAFALDRAGRRLATFDPALGKMTLWDTSRGGSSGELAWPPLASSDGSPRAAPDFLTSFETAFSPEGRWLATVAHCGSVRTLVLWDLNSPAQPRALARRRDDSDQGGPVFLSDGRQLAFPTAPHVITCWPLPTVEPAAPIQLPLELVGSPSPDAAGHRLLCPCAGPEPGRDILLVWNLARQVEEARIAVNFDLAAAVVAVHPAADRLAVGTRDGRIFVLDDHSGARLITLPGAHAARVMQLRWQGDGQHLVSWGVESMLKQWQVAEPPGGELVSGRRPAQLAVSADGRHLALSDGVHRDIQVVDRRSGNVVRELPDREPASSGSLLFSPDGRRLACIREDRARIWNVATGELAATLDETCGLAGVLTSALFTPDGVLLVVAENGFPMQLSVWDVGRHQRLWQSTRNDLKTAYLCPDGLTLAATLKITPPTRTRMIGLALASGRQVHESELSDQPWGAQPFSPDGRWLLTLNSSQGNPVYDFLTDGRTAPPPDLVVEHFPASAERHTIAGPSVPSAHVFSQDSRLLAIGYRDGTVKLWDLHRAELVLHSQFCPQPVVRLALADEGRSLVIGDASLSIRWLDLVALRQQLADVGLDW